MKLPGAGAHNIESDVVLMLNNRYGTAKSMKGNFDAHLPVNMFASKFVYSALKPARRPLCSPFGYRALGLG